MDTFQSGEITYARWKLGGDSLDELRRSVASEVSCFDVHANAAAASGLATTVDQVFPSTDYEVARFVAGLRAQGVLRDTLAPKQLS